MSEDIIHINLVIGKVDNTVYLICLYEPGSVINLVKRYYWMKILQILPHIFINFVESEKKL